MKIFDLHCDTLYKAEINDTGLNVSDYEVQVENDFEKFFQCFAIWIPDDLKPDDGQRLFDCSYKRLKKECIKNEICFLNNFSEVRAKINQSKKLAFFTLENCKILDNEIENVKHLSNCKVKLATLTWNDENCIGGGADTKNKIGLTDFGKKVIDEFEKFSIIPDVSHASDKLFYEVCEVAKKPFVATHSNSRTITNHRRNLTDEQFRIICSRGGIVGLNFHNAFLNENADKANINDIIKHIYHFLSLGGENHISIGSDFDGGTLPCDIKNNLDLYKIYDTFLQNNFSESIINKIFYENAVNFFENFDI